LAVARSRRACRRRSPCRPWSVDPLGARGDDRFGVALAHLRGEVDDRCAASCGGSAPWRRLELVGQFGVELDALGHGEVGVSLGRALRRVLLGFGLAFGYFGPGLGFTSPASAGGFGFGIGALASAAGW
jgi:hypothetical protein